MKFKHFVAAATVLSTLGSVPAQAAVSGCMENDTFGSFLLSDLIDGFTCQVGDKIYSNFSYEGFATTNPAPIATTVQLSQSAMGAQHTIGMMNTGGWTSPTSTFKYTVTVAATSPESLLSWAATTSSSIIGSSWSTNVTATNSVPGVVNFSGAGSNADTPQPFNGGTISSDFVNTFTVANNFTSWDNSLNQTPGPLPILGAGAAFGFSRKLRNRIKSVA